MNSDDGKTSIPYTDGPRGKKLFLQLPSQAAYGTFHPLPPTDAGWEQFVKLGVARKGIEGFKYADLNRAALYWWGRRFPTGLLPSKKKTEKKTVK
jgi:hypothetical protein